MTKLFIEADDLDSAIRLMQQAAVERGVEKARKAEEDEKRAEAWYARCKQFAKEAGFGETTFRTLKETFGLQARLAKHERDLQETKELREAQPNWGEW